MKDETGRVAIDGFYDDVRPITDLDRETLDSMPFDSDAVMSNLDVSGFVDGPGDSYLEKLLYYPTLNVAGFTSGYSGDGTKTIIPSNATVKIDMRLVADQDPDLIFERFRHHVESNVSGSVDVEVTKMGTMSPQRTPLDHPIRNPVLDAVAEGWGTEPILKPTLGGSLPTASFVHFLNTPVVIVPYANSDEDNHSPDENIALDCFENGIRTTIAVLERFADYDS
jgi:acetylornithine deacetylase/succinyl-diaminopimelate desuccinylase-like protein